jgi:hypothetical protein
MVVANLATERGTQAVPLAPMMFGQEPLLRTKKQRRKALNSQKGGGQKGEREKETPRSEMQGRTIRIKESVSTSPVVTGTASSGTRAASSTKARKEEEEEVNGKGTLPYSLPKPTRRRSSKEIEQRAGRQ